MIAVADSSALISGFVQSDSNHELAIEAQQKMTEDLITIYIPAEIFSETLNIIGKKISHKAAIQFVKAISSTGIFQIIESDENIRLSALDKFKKQPESISFTDCLVMAFADHLETKVIFGFDRSFSQNGYQLLK